MIHHIIQTMNILLNAIAALDSSKAMGPDSIHNLMIKKTGPLFRQLLCNIFNMSFESGIQPSQWNLDIIIPIPKPKRDHSLAKNYRPIAISSTVGRLLQKILAQRLQHYTYQLQIFKSNQSGFQINRSCIDAIIPLYQTILQSQDINSYTQLLQTDFSKAYDTVWHNGLCTI